MLLILRANKFKQELSFEPYLELQLPGPVIKLFTKLRGGLLRFEIHEGRWANPKIALNERKCRLCNLDRIKDEEHVLFHCPVWATFRHQMNSYPEFENKDFVTVCTSTNEIFIKDLCRFLNVVLFEKFEILEVL